MIFSSSHHAPILKCSTIHFNGNGNDRVPRFHAVDSAAIRQPLPLGLCHADIVHETEFLSIDCWDPEHLRHKIRLHIRWLSQ